MVQYFFVPKIVLLMLNIAVCKRAFNKLDLIRLKCLKPGIKRAVNPLSADVEYTRHLRDEIPTHRHWTIPQNHFVFASVKLLPYEKEN